ncbi:uncharacterized protein TRUGW13939_05756 [Talaromyces rugulosus]|uniref:MARVEL domain-containing protein n=1 Tax=Talaromyces rugulosus TaxID=121627 RepID=A0A7H8QYY1_TALRU|nr:uncharacterized protein TRUGW13939_05756 [Talaromyces rugulosus]QKX58631.1 hypothetical protein TRUGW13939_05756 [Talaromyces rugulosus]
MGRASFMSSPYSAGPFYFARGLWAISTVIVTAIMIYFAIHLHADGFKLPFAFVILLIACFLTLFSLILTGILHCSNRLSPVLSMVLNIILFILWIASIGLLGYSMKGTISVTCDTSNWGTSTGVMVCRLYKTLFSFVVISLAMTFLHIILDVVARRDRYNLSRVGSMRYRDEDIKLNDRTESSVPALSGGALTEDPSGHHRGADAYNAFGTVRPEEPQYTHRHPVPEDDYPSHNMTTNPYHDDGFENEPQPAHHHHAAAVSSSSSNNNNHEYYDGVPDIPAVPGSRWAAVSNNNSTPYSPLNSRFDEQTGYESYRPQPTQQYQHTPYDRYDYTR